MCSYVFNQIERKREMERGMGKNRAIEYFYFIGIDRNYLCKRKCLSFVPCMFM